MSELDFSIKENTLTIVSGEQGIGKTEFAINAAVDYFNKTGKSVILLFGKYPSFYTQKMLKEIPDIISEKIYILKQLYQYRDELSLINYLERKIIDFGNIGLVIIDDDSNFIINKKILSEYKALLTRHPISVLIISSTKHRKHKLIKPLFKYINPIYFKSANEIYGLLPNDECSKNEVFKKCEQLRRLK